jgi:hypothetical protein
MNAFGTRRTRSGNMDIPGWSQVRRNYPGLEGKHIFAEYWSLPIREAFKENSTVRSRNDMHHCMDILIDRECV